MNDRLSFARELQFFKALINDFSKRLSIPEAFTEEIQDELHGPAILQGPSGNCWLVKFNRTSKGTYLEGGWETFVEDNSLTEGEFLVFSCVRSMHFNVQIFGRNACERGTAVQASLGSTCSQLERKTQSPGGDEYMFTANDTFRLKAFHGWSSLKQRNKCQLDGQDAGKIASTSNLEVLGENAKEAAIRFTSKLPCFRIQIKSYSLDTHRYLTVPAVFVRDFVPKTTRLIMLRTASGGEWIVKFCYCIGSTSRISRGWTQFASDNHIKEGDYCVFEYVHEDIFQVHIFRC